ncbi:MAG: F420-dependent glucose-6-phosphate dehydrogenase [Acidimicrobiales bacterium]|nr:MAG: TIGR03560 family F420-dependent LLM class oxidoreductase [Actinomycetota bacterium]MBV6509349.1 F420-dependent glucose-6-phosphate dehydrogenase [Acidimicrobiales bacterium]RIK04615.1 MAG: LLM class F420-dependent oxidoreductase [Acidobacteriota bacterium]
MRLGLDLAQQRLSWDELAARAHLAEDAAFDGIWGFDHFQPMYGSGPGECFEGYTTLAALAGQTSRIRLGLLVTGVTYRHPSLLAAEAITVDHASAGRLELGLGAAWFDKEHHELGFAFPGSGDRIDMLDETLQIVTALFTSDQVDFEGEHYRLRDATLLPRPVQRPHPPIWIGASGEKRMLPLVARYADAWHAFGEPAQLAGKSRLLDDLAEQAGRDPRSILRAASLSLSEPWDHVRRTADEFRNAGFGYLVCGWPSEGRTRLDEFVETVMPELSD